MKLKRYSVPGALALLICQGAGAQTISGAGAGLNELSTPGVYASLAVGFNYDYLRSPLKVDYKQARGMFGINVPFSVKPSAESVAQMLSSAAGSFTDGEYFAPSVAVKQFANTTLQVDVPFYGGVLEWSHMRMMNIKYSNLLGLPNFTYQPETLPGAESMKDVDLSLILKGKMSVPVGFDLGWETMTFGYAYNFNDKFAAAVNLNRHYFYADILGNIDIDILGKINMATEVENVGTISEEINPNYSLHNQVDGFYDLRKWTPTIAGEWFPTIGKWKPAFQVIARFGFTDYAKGSLYGGYAVPFFIDPQSFKTENLTAEYIQDNLGRFKNSDISEVAFQTNHDLLWSMPSAFTVGADLVKDKINLSYTKFAGSVRMELVDNDFQKGEGEDQLLDTLDVRLGADVDHMVLLQGDFSWIFFNLGIFAFDVSFDGRDQLIRTAAEGQKGVIPYGDGIMVPITSGGVVIGDKMQVKVEGHLTPFPAFNTALIYHF